MKMTVNVRMKRGLNSGANSMNRKSVGPEVIKIGGMDIVYQRVGRKCRGSWCEQYAIAVMSSRDKQSLDTRYCPKYRHSVRRFWPEP